MYVHTILVGSAKNQHYSSLNLTDLPIIAIFPFDPSLDAIIEYFPQLSLIKT